MKLRRGHERPIIQSSLQSVYGVSRGYCVETSTFVMIIQNQEAQRRSDRPRWKTLVWPTGKLSDKAFHIQAKIDHWHALQLEDMEV